MRSPAHCLWVSALVSHLMRSQACSASGLPAGTLKPPSPRRCSRLTAPLGGQLDVPVEEALVELHQLGGAGEGRGVGGQLTAGEEQVAVLAPELVGGGGDAVPRPQVGVPLDGGQGRRRVHDAGGEVLVEELAAVAPEDARPGGDAGGGLESPDAFGGGGELQPRLAEVPPRPVGRREADALGPEERLVDVEGVGGGVVGDATQFAAPAHGVDQARVEVSQGEVLAVLAGEGLEGAHDALGRVVGELVEGEVDDGRRRAGRDHGGELGLVVAARGLPLHGGPALAGGLEVPDALAHRLGQLGHRLADEGVDARRRLAGRGGLGRLPFAGPARGGDGAEQCPDPGDTAARPWAPGLPPLRQARSV